ncbi:NAD(P)/FAD-dependent oxidoreductase [Rhodococcus sp. OK302]|uniref:NAD(P)/FAD-dependent oxidoreductase n=1 Tax=Rhodococcus sp. OK302 TaxID=1882769 RepID=UPI000B9439DD|nr:FAD/NAD(P)-binding oxidoreductase [Rhodococcus sp. OK302]OYD70990.1 3-phenylpropionate/trans-cinnamate dioxygenase ferredoxin reductase subunit [Rhodococcus sp. OK302]
MNNALLPALAPGFAAPARAGGVVIVGAGQAGFQVSASLRDGGYAGPITLLGDESELPYQRPPLSKGYLTDSDESAVVLRGQEFYDKRSICVRPGTRVRALCLDKQQVELADGTRLGYGHLVLATGARPRQIAIPGVDQEGVVMLRTRSDADNLRAHLDQSRRLVIVGAGFIGMEAASWAALHGHHVTVIETADRPLANSVSAETSGYLTDLHRDNGVRILLGAAVSRFCGSDGQLTAVELDNGDMIAADLVLVGVGAVPNVELAASAGLTICDRTGGVLVNQNLRTQDDRVSAIGDCATYPSVHGAGLVRLESVQNAVDHARHVAALLVDGGGEGYRSVPWFWSNQYDAKLQIAGIGDPDNQCVVVGDPENGTFSVLRFGDVGLVAVESVNRPTDHMAARKILAGTQRPTVVQAHADGFQLKSYLRDVQESR